MKDYLKSEKLERLQCTWDWGSFPHEEREKLQEEIMCRKKNYLGILFIICLIFCHLHIPNHPKRTVIVKKITVYPCIYVCVYIQTYNSYMHSSMCFSKLILRIIGFNILLQCLCSFTWDKGNFFSKFSKLIFLILFCRDSEHIYIFYLLSLFRRYLERLINVTSSYFK